MTTQLRPLSLSELLDRTFQLYRQHFMLFVGIVALPQLVLLAAQLTGTVTDTFPPTGLSVAWLWFLGLMVVALFVTVMIQGAMIVAVSQLQLGRPVTIGSAYERMRGHVRSLVLLTITIGSLILLAFGLGMAAFFGIGIGLMAILGRAVGAVFTGFGAVVMLIAVLLLALRWSLAVPVAILEHLPVWQSISRSSALTRGDRGRVFMIYLLYFFLLMVGTSVWQVPTMAATFAAVRSGVPPPMWTQIVNNIGAFFTQCLISPIITIAISLLYYDERVRKEAFDIQHMIDELGESVVPT